jgi:hypothetical protein
MQLTLSKIDKKIRSLVLILNELDIPTSGSCEGHIDHGSPAPWVKVTPSKRATSRKRNLGGRRSRRVRNDRVRERILWYLNRFYKNRHARRDVRIVIEDANYGSWIHNSGRAYVTWRKFVDQSVAKIKRGEKVREDIDAEERKRRSGNLPLYQKEMEAFAEFLKQEVGKRLD